MVDIARQDFNDVNTDTSNSDRFPAGSLSQPLTNDAASFDPLTEAGSGTGFQTVWSDTRGNEGPTEGSENGDFIGANSFTGNGAPDVARDGTPVAAGVEQNFQFNDGDGLLELVFGLIDTTGFVDRQFSLDYWINDGGFEADDLFRVTFSDGATDDIFLNFDGTELNARASADDGTANWGTASANLDGLGLGDMITVTIAADVNSGAENIFVDNVAITGNLDGETPVLISEFEPNPTGTDPDPQRIELTGAPNSSFTGWLLSIESDGGSGAGTVDRAVQFTANFDPVGIAIIEVPDLENPSFTYVLTDAFTGEIGTTDLDTDNDGTADDLSSLGTVLDAIGVPDTAGEPLYGAQLGGEDFSFTGTEPRLVFRSGGDGDWFALNDPDNGQVFNIDAIDVTPAAFDVDPTLGTSTLGSENPVFEGLVVTFTDRMIHEIQGATDLANRTAIGSPGDADESPLLGDNARVQGIVTAIQPDLGGFYVQEEDADADADAASSEGIFVFDGGAAVVVPGDLVTVEGTVAEIEGETRLATGLEGSVTIDGTDNPLPAPVVLDFPTATVLTTADGDLVPNLEAYEGMLVTVPEEMTVSELFQLDRFGTMRVSADGVPSQFTQTDAPDVAGFTQFLEDLAARTLVLDDGSNVQNPSPILVPDLGADGTLDGGDVFRIGDTYTGITGVVSYSEDDQDGFEEPEFRIHRPDAELTQTNPRPEAPEPVGGSFSVASFNVLNFFTTLDTFPGDEEVGPNSLTPRGADTNPQNALPGTGATDEYDRQLAKLVEAITALEADVLGLIEIENDFLGEGGIRPIPAEAQAPRDIAIQELVDAINDALGGVVYDWVQPGGEFVGGDAIAVGFIYDTTTTEITPGSTVDFLTDDELAGLGLDFGNPVFEGDGTSRSPLAASFTEIATGEDITIAVNHFKSKGSLSPFGDNEDAGDGAGRNNEARVQAATAVDAWLDSDPTGTGDADVLIIGDLNSYQQEDPITFLEGEGYTDLAEAFLGTEAASFIFDGQQGTLDYILASESAAAKATGATEWRIASPEPDAFDYNLEFGRDPALFSADDPFRASDHDPLLVGFQLGDIEPPVATGDTATTGVGMEVTVDLIGNDTGTGIAVTAVGTADNGEVALVGGAAVYTPDAGFEGVDTFRYTLENAAGTTVEGLAAVTVGTPEEPEGADGVLRGTGRADPILIGQNATYLGLGGVDTFIVSQAALPGTSVIEGQADRIQFVEGVEIVSSIVTPDALQIDLSTGARVQILNAGGLEFEFGGNATTGQIGTVGTYAEFADAVLGVAVPEDGEAFGSPVIVPGPEDDGLMV